MKYPDHFLSLELSLVSHEPLWTVLRTDPLQEHHLPQHQDAWTGHNNSPVPVSLQLVITGAFACAIVVSLRNAHYLRNKLSEFHHNLYGRQCHTSKVFRRYFT